MRHPLLLAAAACSVLALAAAVREPAGSPSRGALLGVDDEPPDEPKGKEKDEGKDKDKRLGAGRLVRRQPSYLAYWLPVITGALCGLLVGVWRWRGSSLAHRLEKPGEGVTVHLIHGDDVKEIAVALEHRLEDEFGCTVFNPAEAEGVPPDCKTLALLSPKMFESAACRRSLIAAYKSQSPQTMLIPLYSGDAHSKNELKKLYKGDEVCPKCKKAEGSRSFSEEGEDPEELEQAKKYLFAENMADIANSKHVEQCDRTLCEIVRRLAAHLRPSKASGIEAFFKKRALYSHDVFISYNTGDNRQAFENLSAALASMGCDIFNPSVDMQGGQVNLGTMQDHVRGSALVICMPGRGYFKSMWCRGELEAAIEANIPVVVAFAGETYTEAGLKRLMQEDPEVFIGQREEDREAKAKACGKLLQFVLQKEFHDVRNVDFVEECAATVRQIAVDHLPWLRYQRMVIRFFIPLLVLGMAIFLGSWVRQQMIAERMIQACETRNLQELEHAIDDFRMNPFYTDATFTKSHLRCALRLEVQENCTELADNGDVESAVPEVIDMLRRHEDDEVVVELAVRTLEDLAQVGAAHMVGDNETLMVVLSAIDKHRKSESVGRYGLRFLSVLAKNDRTQLLDKSGEQTLVETCLESLASHDAKVWRVHNEALKLLSIIVDDVRLPPFGSTSCTEGTAGADEKDKAALCNAQLLPAVMSSARGLVDYAGTQVHFQRALISLSMKSQANVDVMLRAGVADMVVANLDNHPGDLKVAQTGLKLLGILLPRSQVLAVPQGANASFAVPVIVRTMRLNPKQQVVQENGAVALQPYAADEGGRAEILKGDAIRTVVTAMRSHAHDDGVTHKATELLKTLLERSVEARERLMAQGATQVMWRELENWVRDVDIQYEAISCLLWLVKPDEDPSNTVRILSTAMYRNQQNTTFILQAMMLLRNFTVTDVGLEGLLAGSVLTIGRAMRDHVNVTGIATVGVEILSRLAVHPGKARETMVRWGVGRVMSHVLGTYSETNPGLTRSVVELLHVLAQEKSTRIQMVRDVADAIVRITRSPSLPPGMMEMIGFTLCDLADGAALHLVKGDRDDKDKQGHVVPVLQDLLLDTANVELYRNLTMAFMQLAMEPSNAYTLMLQGTLRTLSDVLVRYKTDLQVLQFGVAAIAKLTTQVPDSPAIPECVPVFTASIMRLPADQDVIFKAALDALWEIVSQQPDVMKSIAIALVSITKSEGIGTENNLVAKRFAMIVEYLSAEVRARYPLVEAGGAGLLVDITTPYITDMKMQQDVACSLSRMAQVEVARAKLVLENAAVAVQRALHAYPQDAEIQACGVEGIWLLSMDQDSRQQLVRQGAANALRDYLSATSALPSKAQTAVEALVNFAHVPENRWPMVNDGIGTALKRALRAKTRDRRVEESAVEVLWWLVEDGQARERLLKEQANIALQDEMDVSYRNETYQSLAVDTFRILAQDAADCEQLVREGMIDRITAAMRKHPDEESVQRDSLAVLKLVARDTKSRRMMMNSSAIPTMKLAVTGNLSVAIKADAVEAFVTLATDPKLKMELIAYGVPAIMQDMILAHLDQDHESLVLAGLMCLREFSEAQQHRKELMHAGFARTVLQVMKAMPDASQIQETALWTMFHLARGRESRASLIADNAIEIIRMVRDHYTTQDTQIRYVARIVLRNLGYMVEDHQSFYETTTTPMQKAAA